MHNKRDQCDMLLQGEIEKLSRIFSFTPEVLIRTTEAFPLQNTETHKSLHTISGKSVDGCLGACPEGPNNIYHGFYRIALALGTTTYYFFLSGHLEIFTVANVGNSKIQAAKD